MILNYIVSVSVVLLILLCLIVWRVIKDLDRNFENIEKDLKVLRNKSNRGA